MCNPQIGQNILQLCLTMCLLNLPLFLLLTLLPLFWVGCTQLYHSSNIHLHISTESAALFSHSLFLPLQLLLYFILLFYSINLELKILVKTISAILLFYFSQSHSQQLIQLLQEAKQIFLTIYNLHLSFIFFKVYPISSFQTSLSIFYSLSLPFIQFWSSRSSLLVISQPLIPSLPVKPYRCLDLSQLGWFPYLQKIVFFHLRRVVLNHGQSALLYFISLTIISCQQLPLQICLSLSIDFIPILYVTKFYAFVINSILVDFSLAFAIFKLQGSSFSMFHIVFSFLSPNHKPNPPNCHTIPFKSLCQPPTKPMQRINYRYRNLLCYFFQAEAFGIMVQIRFKMKPHLLFFIFLTIHCLQIQLGLIDLIFEMNWSIQILHHLLIYHGMRLYYFQTKSEYFQNEIVYLVFELKNIFYSLICTLINLKYTKMYYKLNQQYSKIMLFFQDRNQFITPINPVKSIGTRIELVPDKVIKILYREGEGPCAKSGASINVFYTCYTIQGKQLLKKRNTSKKLPVGTKRLIQGLQIALLTARRHQKFSVIIAPQYGYKNIETRQFIPKNETIIFQFQIISIDYPSMSQKSEVELFAHIKLQLQSVDKLLQQEKQDQAISRIRSLCDALGSVRCYKSDIHLVLFVKWGYILFKQKKYKQAEQLCEAIKTLDSSNCNYLKLSSKVYLALKKTDKALAQMQKISQMYGDANLELRRNFVQFLKQNNQYQILRNLSGYDYLKDKVHTSKRSRKNHYLML